MAAHTTRFSTRVKVFFVEVLAWAAFFSDRAFKPDDA
jgi:hypothetical protein